MDIAFHIGSHCTDEDRLVRSLLRDRGPLAQRGVVVPAPGRYRSVLRETLATMKGAPSQDAQEVLLDAILGGDDQPDRLVLSHDQFLGLPARVVTPRGFHAGAGRRIAALATLFPYAACEFHIALRNPATLLPALIQLMPGSSYADLMGERDPMSLRWGPVVQAIAAAVPDARLVVFCNEDAPVMWPEILARVAGVEDMAFAGAQDMLASVLTPAGFRRMTDYLAANPPASSDQRRRIASVFLDKFARAEAVEVDLPFPGWTESLVTRMSEAYEADLAEIARLPGVEVLAP